MNLALVYKNINSPSYIFYKDAFKKIGKNNKSIKVTFEKFSKKTLEKNFDVILFMSGAANENFEKKKILNMELLILELQTMIILKILIS